MQTPTDTSPPDPGGRRWGRIPAWWLDHPDLDADGLAVLAALATYADAGGVCWPSQSTLADKLKRSRPTVNRILQRLEGLGLVRIEPRRGADGARLSSRYRLALEPLAGAGVRPDTGADRDDSAANPGCSPASQEQPHSEQTPASTARVSPLPKPVAAAWTPGPDDLAWARKRFAGIDVASHAEGFALRCQAHGYRYRDTAAAWRAWLVEDAAAGRAPRTTAPPAVSMASASPGTARQQRSAPPAASGDRLGAWLAAAARLGGATGGAA